MNEDEDEITVSNLQNTSSKSIKIRPGKLLLLSCILFIFTTFPFIALAYEYSIVVKISEQKLYLMNGSE